MTVEKQFKILFISSWYPNKLEPTNGNFVQRHAEAVATLHQVEVLHAIGNQEQKERFVFDEKVIHGIRTLVVYYKNTKNPLLNFYRRMKAYKIGFQRMSFPDLIHGNVLHNNMFFAVYLKKKYSIPFVITEHWTALRQKNAHITPKAVQITARIIGNFSNFLLPVSEDLQKGLHYLKIKTPMKVIPNVVDTSLFSPSQDQNSKYTFIHVSNLIPRKNPDIILETAIGLMNKGFDFQLQLGGDGNAEVLERLRTRVEKSGHQNKIEIFGMQTISQIAYRMKNSDCFILLSNDENQPCVIAEAFASGLQIISTRVGGIAEFLPENFGLLLEIPDSQLLEEAMVKMLRHKIPRNSAHLNAYAENTFSIKTIAQEFDKVYKKILNNC
ncbi:MAG: glycosyltransferase [Bacteroidetes bacterium]|nr:glycosyltransferase [Bacteroidota bacterium]